MNSKSYKIFAFILCITIIIILFHPIYATDSESATLLSTTWSGGSIGAKTYTSSETIELTGDITLTGLIKINSGVTLTIQGNGTITRGSSYTGALFRVSDGGKLVITGDNGNNNDIIIDGNRDNVTSTSTVIDCYETLELTNVTIRNNKNSANIGGGIHVRPSDVNVNLTNCVIDSCTSNAGSGIYLFGAGSGPVKISKTIIENCTTDGGTIRTNGSGNWQLTIEDSVIRNNICTGNGCGIYWNANATDAMLEVKDSHIINNESGNKGGGLFLEGSNMVVLASDGTPTTSLETGNIPDEGIVGTLIQGNTATISGGGIYVSGYAGGLGVGMSGTDSFNLTLSENVIIRDNSAPIGGGVGLNLKQADPADGYTYNITIDGAQLYQNKATDAGGAIYCKLNYDQYNVNVTMKTGTVLENEAQNGGAFYVSGCNFKMEGGTVSYNQATVDGGAIYVTDSSYTESSTTYPIGCSFTMNGGEVSNNNTMSNGGGVYVSGGDFTMTNGIISNNEATGNGGGIYAGSTDKDIEVQVLGGEIINNKSNQHGGGIDVNMGTGMKANIIIGLELCKGIDITQHGEGASCPKIENNRALEEGGGLCLHGDTDMAVVKMYCGELYNNVATQKTGGGNLNQTGGTFIIYGGDIGNNILIAGGEYIDERPTDGQQQITIRYHTNYSDGTTNSYVDSIVTVGMKLNLPGDVFEQDGSVLSGWSTSATDGTEGYLPVNASYVVEYIDDGCLDLYAVWDAQHSFIIKIPDELPITVDGNGTAFIGAELTYFSEAASLNVTIESFNNFSLKADNNSNAIEYTLSLNDDILTNNSTIATFKYNDTVDRILMAELSNKEVIKNSGTYTDILTFVINYDDGIGNNE